jgi:hypothetical protein
VFNLSLGGRVTRPGSLTDVRSLGPELLRLPGTAVFMGAGRGGCRFPALEALNPGEMRGGGAYSELEGCR